MNPEDNDVVYTALVSAQNIVSGLHSGWAEQTFRQINKALPIARRRAKLMPLYADLVSVLFRDFSSLSGHVQSLLKAIDEAKRHD